MKLFILLVVWAVSVESQQGDAMVEARKLINKLEAFLQSRDETTVSEFLSSEFKLFSCTEGYHWTRDKLMDMLDMLPITEPVTIDVKRATISGSSLSFDISATAMEYTVNHRFTAQQMNGKYVITAGYVTDCPR